MLLQIIHLMNHRDRLSAKIAYLWVKKFNLCWIYKYCLSRPSCILSVSATCLEIPWHLFSSFKTKLIFEWVFVYLFQFHYKVILSVTLIARKRKQTCKGIWILHIHWTFVMYSVEQFPDSHKWHSKTQLHDVR